MSRELDKLRRLTRARPESIEAVRSGIDQAVPTGSAVGSALSRIPTPQEGAVDRVRAAVLARDPRPTASPPWGPIAGAGLAVLLVAGSGAWWAAAPAPGTPPAAPEIVEHASGALSTPAPVDVVRTREAVVHQVGPQDAVVRDVHGTTVTGSAAARTTCLGPYAQHTVERVVCAPVSAAGLLALAEAQRDEGAAPAQVLTWLDRAASLHDEDAVHAEIQATRVLTLHEAGQQDAALELARAHRTSGRTERADEVARVGAAIALSRQDCQAAAPFLAELAPQAFDAALAWASCAPEHREQALDHAARLASTPAERDALRAVAPERVREGAD